MRNLTHAATLILAAATAGLLSGPAAAQTHVHGHNCEEERSVPVEMLTEQTHRRLEGIFQDIGDENYASAYDGLQTMARRRLGDYEAAVVAQAMGFVRAQQERYQEAIEHMREAIRLNKLPNSQHFEMILQTAQIYNILERYDDAIRQLEIWFCVVSEEQTRQIPDVWVLKASLHIQKNEFRQALEAVDQAIALADEPKESWYRIKLGMHFELKEFRPGIQVLKILIGMNPDRKEYWTQMAGGYMELDDEAEAKATLRLAYRRGMLDRESEFIQLASLVQSQGAPRQAAEVLEDGIERGIVENTRRNWEMAAGAWYEARNMDKALHAYERAGARADDGKLDLQRSHILVNEERWDEAIDALARALRKGGLSQTEEGNIHLLTGMAQFNLGDLQSAEQAFNRAANYGRLRTAAQEWLNHIRRERQRRAGL